MCYFLRFGSRTFLANVLSMALERIDDLWTGSYLGTMALGSYSRAYNFAVYPRTILATPIETVTKGAYAELKGDRLRLSQAFFRINALLVRSGFLLAGLLILVAPEFIRLALGDKWLPMLYAFRWMLLFTMLDPIQKTVEHLFLGVGEPGQAVRVHLVQLLVLVIGLALLGPWLKITGVALAVDMMMVVGIALLLWRAKTHVDVSLQHLFAVPGLALIFGLLAARTAITWPGVFGSDWRTAFVKLIVFSAVYGIMVGAYEHRQIGEALSWLTTSGPKKEALAILE